jgi:tight adherence protein B
MGDKLLFIGLLAMTVACVGALLVQSVFAMMEAKRRTLQQRLGNVIPEDTAANYGSLVLQKSHGEMIALQARSMFFKNFSAKLHRAYPGVILGRFLFLVCVLGGFAFIVGAVGLGSIFMGLIAATVAVSIPFMRVNSKVSKRLRIIDEQLPEALDFLSRILRAGHSLTTGFQMASDELPDPLASEFRTCYDQHSLGAPIENAMREMADRVGTSDFAFFVTAVLIQRQTGGDLAEVLNNIGGMIRARLRLQQHVKAITAQGRMVGTILLIMPVFFFIVLYLLNPEYASVLLKEKEGFIVLCVAVGLQVMGMIAIKRIVAVRM